jgi:UTP:GlnB (protein PII) uridylyltransferase
MIANTMPRNPHDLYSTPTQESLRALRLAAQERGLNADQIAELGEVSPPLWSSVPSEAQIDDLALLLRPLTPGEIRVRVIAPNADELEWEVTVVAADRLGLLAITSTVLASFGLTVTSARIGTWPEGKALQHLWVRPHTKSSVEPPWATIGQTLRHALENDASATLAPSSVAMQWVRSVERIEADPESPIAIDRPDRYLVVIETTDIPGVLSAISSRFGHLGLNVIAAEIATVDGLVKDRFVIEVPASLRHRVAQLKG